MDTTLAANPRTPTNKSAARSLRRAGQVPAVLYGPSQEVINFSVSPEELEDIFNTTGDRNTLLQLQLAGATHAAFVREVQRHPVSREILHVDFYAPPKDKKIEVMVRVTTTGKPAGAMLGGRLRVIRREVKALCQYDAIPSAFVVDVSSMEINDMVKASEVSVPDGVEIVYDHDFNVVTVYGKRGGAEDEEEGTEEGEAAEAPAEDGAETEG
jgi:large subunit ribosomal protein L25